MGESTIHRSRACKTRNGKTRGGGRGGGAKELRNSKAESGASGRERRHYVASFGVYSRAIRTATPDTVSLSSSSSSSSSSVLFFYG